MGVFVEDTLYYFIEVGRLLPTEGHAIPRQRILSYI